MSETIYKFTFNSLGVADADIPADAVPLHVGVQRAGPCIWVRLNAEARCERRRFRMIGTGWPDAVQPDWPYVGTFMMHEGALVFHVFEVPHD